MSRKAEKFGQFTAYNFTILSHEVIKARLRFGFFVWRAISNGALTRIVRTKANTRCLSIMASLLCFVYFATHGFFINSFEVFWEVFCNVEFRKKSTHLHSERFWLKVIWVTMAWKPHQYFALNTTINAMKIVFVSELPEKDISNVVVHLYCTFEIFFQVVQTQTTTAYCRILPTLDHHVWDTFFRYFKHKPQQLIVQCYLHWSAQFRYSQLV